MKLAIFASGQGSNFLKLSQACKSGVIKAEVEMLVTNRFKAGALEYAEELGVPALVSDPNQFESFEQWDEHLVEAMSQLNIDLIILAGFLRKIGPKLIENFKIINTHPSLLPKFGGQGMYGHHIHKKVIESGDKETGVTIHRVTPGYDEGPLIAQKNIPVSKEDTAETLEEKVKRIENIFFVETVSKICSGELKL